MSESSPYCQDCGAAVSYNYCAVCGQETRLHVPSAGEFFHEFVGHYIAIEGKLWQTMLMLLLEPGKLTAEYLHGRRTRYVQPLRLYLTLSLVFFALLKFGGMTMVDFDADRKEDRTLAEIRQDKPIVPIDIKVLGKPVDLNAKLETFDTLSGANKAKMLTDGFFSYGPYALFCLLPLFALYLKLLYLRSQRRYGEHLLFAMHTNAFAYFMLLVLASPVWGLIKAASVAWLVLYLPLAMRRVYGGGRAATALRWIVLMTLHGLSIALAILAAGALAIIK